MRAKRTLGFVVCLWGLAGLLACHDEPIFETIEEDCSMGCAVSFGCHGIVDPEWEAECRTSCVDYSEESLERIGRDCAEVYEELIRCRAALTCDEYKTWSNRLPVPYSCQGETERFLDLCPGIWFAPER